MAKVFKVFTDKTKEFECKVRIEGASIQHTEARLVLEGTLNTVMYKGSIDPKGWCTIHVNPIRNIFNAGDVGKAKLEVIAEDTYFVPWKSDFKVESEKKVTVEVIDRGRKTVNKKKPRVTAIVSTKSRKQPFKPLNEKKVTIKSISKKLHEHLIKSGVNKRMIYANPKKVNSLVEHFLKRYRFGGQSGKKIVIRALNKIHS